MRLPLRWKRARTRAKNRQAGPAAGAVVTAPQGKRVARAGLAQRLGNAMLLRAFYRSVASTPASVALAVGVALGLVLGVALVLGTFAQLVAQEAAA